MIVIAVASGTSLDAFDVAAVELVWSGADTADLHVLGVSSAPWPTGLVDRLLALVAPAGTSAAELCTLDTQVGQAVAAMAADAVHSLAGGRADLIVSPGQTVHHEVVGVRCLGTLQIGQPAWVAEATGLPVISDLRARDVAAGGHGAPLASTLDGLWLGELSQRGDPVRAALNLGGIANLTVVGVDGVRAWDTGPGCCLLDVAAQRTSGHRYDAGGALARAGRVRDDLHDRLLDTPYLGLQPPKSTGREMFSATLLDTALAGLPPVADPDLLATLTELTARTVADAVPPEVAEVVASGGGVRNPALMAALEGRLAPRALASSAAYGLDPDGKEVVMWALLGFLTWHGLAGTLPGATGATGPRVLGRITPGRERLVLPGPPPSGTLRRLRVSKRGDARTGVVP